MLITVSTPIRESPRISLIRSIFDLAREATSTVRWDVSLAFDDRPWNIGLIVGPSGCGKSTIARHLWPEAVQRTDALFERDAWPGDRSIVDAFPEDMPVQEVIALLCGVGFSSPPAWLRPFHVLSTGQQFRVILARLLAEADCSSASRPLLAERGEGSLKTLAPSPPTPLPHSGGEGRNSSPSPPEWGRGVGVRGSTILPSHPERGRGAQERGHSPIVFDEYTSVVDRTVARIGSAAVAKAVRQRGGRFIAVTCHEDVEDWLQPDWVYRPAENHFQWRCLRCRPAIELEIVRCASSAWQIFAPHHYLSGQLHRSAVCFLASECGRPVAFSAWLPYMGSGPPRRREHRTVTLPDFQGVGIGNALSACIASLWSALGYRATSTTSHPAMIAARLRSPHWHMHRRPGLANRPERKIQHALMRSTAGFTYIGPPMDRQTALQLLETFDAKTSFSIDPRTHSADQRAYRRRRV